MVFLTITPTILEVIEEIRRQGLNSTQDAFRSPTPFDEQTITIQARNHGEVKDDRSGRQEDHKDIADVEISHRERKSTHGPNDPSLSNPKLGSPISHGQVIDLWNDLKARSPHPRTLDSLLRGSRVYNPPPKPKAEKVSGVLLSEDGCPEL